MKGWQVVPEHQLPAKPYAFERAANRHAQNKVSLFGGAKNSQHLGIKGPSDHPAGDHLHGSVLCKTANSYLEPGTHTHALIDSIRASGQKNMMSPGNNVTIREQEKIPPQSG